MLNKSIAVVFCIKVLSKLVMYKFYYDYLKPRYGNKRKLLFTDTAFCAAKYKHLICTVTCPRR